MPLLNSLVVAVLPLIPKSIVGKVAKRYIAGTQLSDAVHSVQTLNQNSITATMDLLGEDVTNIEEVEVVKKGILSILKAIQENKLGSGVSVKPTQLGLKLDKELAYQNIKTIIKEAAQSGIFVRIDMEDSSTTDATISLYRRLKVEGLRNTGAVIQACLKRSESDIRALVKENADFRLCKGIYDESPSIAFKGRQEIRDNYLKLLRINLENCSQVGKAVMAYTQNNGEFFPFTWGQASGCGGPYDGISTVALGDSSANAIPGNMAPYYGGLTGGLSCNRRRSGGGSGTDAGSALS